MGISAHAFGVLFVAMAGSRAINAAFISQSKLPAKSTTPLLVSPQLIRSIQPSSSSHQTSSLFAGKDEGDEEFHTRDQAETTPQLLKGIWQQIAQGSTMVKGVSED